MMMAMKKRWQIVWTTKAGLMMWQRINGQNNFACRSKQPHHDPIQKTQRQKPVESITSYLLQKYSGQQFCLVKSHEGHGTVLQAISINSNNKLDFNLKNQCTNRDSESVVFKCGQKMALRAFYFIRALTKALTYYYIIRFKRHLLVAIENNRFAGLIAIHLLLSY